MKEPIVFETFREISLYEVRNLTKNEPTSINGRVNVRKYKVTIELIDEPNKVIAERIQKLWDECNNHHHWQPLIGMAKSIGYELKGNAGKRMETRDDIANEDKKIIKNNT